MDNGEYTVLIVDDEEMVTTSISTLFMLETDYEVLTFNSPSEALDALQTQEADLVHRLYLRHAAMPKQSPLPGTRGPPLLHVQRVQPPRHDLFDRRRSTRRRHHSGCLLAVIIERCVGKNRHGSLVA